MQPLGLIAVGLLALHQPAAKLTRRAAVQGGLGAAVLAPAAVVAAPVLDGYDPSSAVTRAAAGRQYFPPHPAAHQPCDADTARAGRVGARAASYLCQRLGDSQTIVVKLKDGTLWVNGPQWPTGEFAPSSTSLVRWACRAAVRRAHAPMKASAASTPRRACGWRPGNTARLARWL